MPGSQRAHPSLVAQTPWCPLPCPALSSPRGQGGAGRLPLLAVTGPPHSSRGRPTLSNRVLLNHETVCLKDPGGLSTGRLKPPFPGGKSAPFPLPEPSRAGPLPGTSPSLTDGAQPPGDLPALSGPVPAVPGRGAGGRGLHSGICHPRRRACDVGHVPAALTPHTHAGPSDSCALGGRAPGAAQGPAGQVDAPLSAPRPDAGR